MGIVNLMRRIFKSGEAAPVPRTYVQLRAYVDKQRDEKRRAAREAMLNRQRNRELSGFYDGNITVAAAMAAQGSGKRLRRHKIDPTGKRRAGNLVRVW